MAGTITADFIRSDANKLSLQVGNTVFASINAMGLLSNTGNVWVSQTGAITANNISVGRIVTPSVMPVGSVLQVQQNHITGKQTAANGFTYTTSALSSPTSSTGSKFLEVSFTPLSATSLIMIQVYCPVITEQTNTSNQSGAAIWKNNTGAPLTVWFAINATMGGGSTVGGINTGISCNMLYTETASSTTTRTYSWYAGVDGAAGYINSFGSDTSFGGQMSSIMTVTEIAQ